MVRIAGVDLPNNKRSEISLTYIYGIGKTTAKSICKEANVDPNAKMYDLSRDEVKNLRQVIENEHKVEGELRREVSMNIKRLMDIGSYRGLRHMRGLPVNGQRTHTNARTRKGRKKSQIGSKRSKKK